MRGSVFGFPCPFQSTLSMRRATSAIHEALVNQLQFQSTLSMRRATDCRRRPDHSVRISIHALHEESDSSSRQRGSVSGMISIHALHEESDLRVVAMERTNQFQSTLSMRRATVQLDIFVRFLRRKPAA